MNIHNLKLFETAHIVGGETIASHAIIRRVPGGWLITETLDDPVTFEAAKITTTFVPYSDEFKDNEDNCNPVVSRI